MFNRKGLQNILWWNWYSFNAFRLRSFKVTGKDVQASLGRANITCNKNSIPFDPKPPKVTSGIRIGTPAATTRGFNNEDFVKVGDLIAETLKGLQDSPENNDKAEENVRVQVKQLCDKYPIYN